MINDDPFLTIYNELRYTGRSHADAWSQVVRVISSPENLMLLFECLEDPAGHELLAQWKDSWTALNLSPPWGEILAPHKHASCNICRSAPPDAAGEAHRAQ